jgi:O-acetyl-ADP-ribose deacetylase (regulator of RNase III)
MIEHRTGNLLEADVEALMNTVNTVGVMGRGIALQFRQAFPHNFQEYQRACKRGEVKPGKMFIVPTGQFTNPRYVINFPTKRHWKGKAKLEDIDAGLVALVEELKKLRIRSVAIPPLGCGNGGLNWGEVRPRIERALSALPSISVLLYAPAHAPEPETMHVATEPPRMTPGRAAVVGLLYRYGVPGYKASLLEVQKLAYFLQEAGEPLKLDFKKNKFGPYAENLNHVLQRIEGHFILGYGDRTSRGALRLADGAVAVAEEYLSGHPDTLARLERVGDLIEGFETPYGMELLATVHWIARHEPAARSDLKVTGKLVQEWSPRKSKLFSEQHIVVAWDRLKEQGWLRSEAQSSSIP